MRAGLNMISFWFGGLMVLVVTGLAVAMIFSDWMSDRIYGNKRILFIVMLLAYAVYRVFRMRAIMRESRRDER